RVHHRAVPGRSRSLLGDDEPLDGRAGTDHAAARAADAGAGRRAAQLAHAAEARDGGGSPGRRRLAGRREAEGAAGSAPGAAQEEEELRPQMSEAAGDLTVETTGETVGEAKWAALRELEARYPALDKAAVRFEVVSEGERGLLGVGYEPARVVAHLPAEAAEAAT